MYVSAAGGVSCVGVTQQVPPSTSIARQGAQIADGYYDNKVCIASVFHIIGRFEMPWNVWCTHCNSHIGRGVRFNAEKKQVGNYFSTKILSFRFKCPACSGQLEMQTDPKNGDFVCIEGLNRKTEDFSGAIAEGDIVIEDKDEKKAIESNPMAKLEFQRYVAHPAVLLSVRKDEIAGKAALPEIMRLQEYQNRSTKDDFAMSQKLRAEFRVGDLYMWYLTSFVILLCQQGRSLVEI